MIEISTLIFYMLICFILSIIFGLYLRLHTITGYYHEFTNKEKKYIKYVPIVFIKIIKQMIKNRDKKLLTFFIRMPSTFYIMVGLSNCILYGDLNLVYESLDGAIDNFKKENNINNDK